MGGGLSLIHIWITNILSDVGKEELADDIINRNQLLPNSVIITYTYKQKNDNHAALAQVTCDAYAKIMKTEHVFIGYQNCKVYDNYNINRCKNCCGYNHSFKICKETIKRPQACFKCSGDHAADAFQSEVKLCINCISTNKYLSKKRAINHAAYYISNCETYKVKCCLLYTSRCV